MPQATDALVARLARLTEPGARGRLVARGLARSYVWRDGRVPDGAPAPSAGLTTDLLDHGYHVLVQALRLLDRLREPAADAAPPAAADPRAAVQRALVVAAESIEAAVRKGPRDDPAHDFHLVVAACAYHLARFAARAYCLAPDPEHDAPTSGPLAGPLAGPPADDATEDRPNLSTPERLLVAVMRRRLGAVRDTCAAWLRDAAHTDAGVAARLADAEDVFDVSDAEVVALTATFVRATGAALTGLERGDGAAIARARALFHEGGAAASERGYVSLWWAHTLARHLVDELWGDSLHVRLPTDLGPGAPAAEAEAERWAALRARYLTVLRNRPLANVELWPSQLEAAVRAIDPADDLIAALPTSAGKTRIAELCMLRTLAQGRRVVYVTPLRALSAQLERTLGRTFRPLGYRVTALYGASGVAAADVATLDDADVVVATPEKLDFALRVQPGVLDDVGLVVLDEGHMIGLGARELRYEALVQRLLRRGDAASRRIVCLSAVFSLGPAFDDFTAWIRADAPGEALREPWRPTRQRSGVITWRTFAGRVGGRLDVNVDGETPFVPNFVPEEAPRGKRKKPFPKDDEELTIAAAKAFVQDGQRVLVYCPLRGSVEALAEQCVRLHRQGHLPNLLPQGADIERALRIGSEWLGEDHVALSALRMGVAVHHGLLPRPFLGEVEDLLTKKSLSLVIASPTLAQGLDLSCGVLIFRSLYRRRALISPAEFANVRGRAGRAYVDLDGLSVFPTYDAARARARVAEYRALEAASEQRELESGLVLLAFELAVLVARALEVPVERLLAYVADVSVPAGAGVGDAPPTELDWARLTERLAALDAAVANAGDDDAAAPDEPVGGAGQAGGEATRLAERFRRALADLDAVLLSLVDDVECAPEVLAVALDAALEGSLWARRLARADEPTRQLARGVVQSRGRWVWARTTPAQRRGYFAAGVGFDTGRYLDAHLDELLANVLTVEAAVAQGTLAPARPGAVPTEAPGYGARDADAMAALVALADRLRAVEPFRFTSVGRPRKDVLRDVWPQVLATWVGGAPLPPLRLAVPALGDDPNAAVGFVQEDVVYRLVWAVEAVRVHAQASGRLEAALLDGSVALALTYGVPTRARALLAQAGLASRTMIARLATDFGEAYTTPEELETWLGGVTTAVAGRGVLAYWGTRDDADLWREFAARWQDSVDSRWTERADDHVVAWWPRSGAGADPGAEGGAAPSPPADAPPAGAPPAGTLCRLVHDGAGGVTYVCDDELRTVGRLRRARPASDDPRATVLPNGQLQVRGYGPARGGAG